MEQEYLYVLFAASTLKMGRFIRMMTGQRYNHVAVTLDEGLRSFYSFARRYRNAPFSGGFVQESSLRYTDSKGDIPIKVCAVAITPEQKAEIAALFEHYARDPEVYLYNTFSALGNLWHRRIPVRNAFTCVEFAVAVLAEYGVKPELNSDSFYTISDLEALLRTHVIYEGPFAAADRGSWREDPYHLRQDLSRRMCRAAEVHLRLIGRMTRDLFGD